MIVIECSYTDPAHQHEYSDDWRFGGANNLDPRADPRWLPTTYRYYNDHAECIWTTQTPLCDDQALDEFTWVAKLGRDYNPVWLAAERPDGSKEMLPWTYNSVLDLLVPRENS